MKRLRRITGFQRKKNHSWQVMVPERLWDAGISISSGEPGNLLTQGHNDFHAEKAERPMTCMHGWHYLQTDDTNARASSQKVLVQGKLHVCSLSFHTMNFLSSVISAWHDHPGQRVLKYFSRFRQQNTLLEKTLTLSQKNNALQRELIVRLQAQNIQQQEQITQLQEKVEALGQWITPDEQTIMARPLASLHGHHYGPTLQMFRNYLTDRLMGIGLFPRPGEVIDKVFSPVLVRTAKSQRMRLCQCLGLVIATSVSDLSAGMLELPLFFPGANPDNVLSLPHSHWRAVVDKPMISETSEKTGVLLLPCDQEPCVVRDYRGRMSLLDLVEMTLPGESGTAERENRKIRKVIQTRDQNGNIIYQWYDQDGHLHTTSEWEYKRRLSMYFQSLLEFLYPEYFGSSMPCRRRLAPVAIPESSQDSGSPGKYRPATMASPANTTPAQRENGKSCCVCSASTTGQVHQISSPP